MVRGWCSTAESQPLPYGSGPGASLGLLDAKIAAVRRMLSDLQGGGTAPWLGKAQSSARRPGAIKSPLAPAAVPSLSGAADRPVHVAASSPGPVKGAEN